MQINWVMLLLGLLCLGGGGYQTYIALRNPEPTVVSCAEYLEHGHHAKWLTLTDSVLLVPNAAYSELKGRVQDLYVPVVSWEDFASGQQLPKIQVLLKVSDPAVKRTYFELSQIVNEEDAQDYMQHNFAQLFPHTDLTGMIEFNPPREELSRLSLDLSPDFVVIARDSRPDLKLSLGFFVFGLFFTLYLLHSARSTAEPDPVEDDA